MLSEKEYKVLQFISQYKKGHDGNAPNMMEVAIEFKTTKQTVANWYKPLQKRGYIKVDPINNRVHHVVIINKDWEKDYDIMNTYDNRSEKSGKAKREYRKKSLVNR